MNSKLEHNDPEGKPVRTKIDQIVDAPRTVAFLEQGCLNESRTLKVQTKGDTMGRRKETRSPLSAATEARGCSGSSTGAWNSSR
jgi:hypothetical protein